MRKYCVEVSELASKLSKLQGALCKSLSCGCTPAPTSSQDLIVLLLVQTQRDLHI